VGFYTGLNSLHLIICKNQSSWPFRNKKCKQLYALRSNAILVSLNGDFADIVSYPPAIYKGIVALQVRNHPEVIPQLLSRLKDYLSSHPDMKHYKGKLLLVEAHRIRIRG
jgi:hypothetical protein